MSQLKLLLLLGLLLAASQTLTTYTYDSQRLLPAGLGGVVAPRYTVGYIDPLTTVRATVILDPSTIIAMSQDMTGLVITLHGLINSNPAAITCQRTSSCTATSKTCDYDCPVVVGSNYQIAGLTYPNYPANPGGATGPMGTPQHLKMGKVIISTYPTGKTPIVLTEKARYIETARRLVVRVINITDNKNLKFTLQPVPDNGTTDVPNLAKMKMGLFKLNATTENGTRYNLLGADLIEGSSFFIRSFTTASNKLQYASSNLTLTGGPGLYILLVSVTVPINYYKLQFTSELYSCPYDPSFIDINGNFQPCIGANSNTTASKSGLPCIQYDAINNICLKCLTGYEAVNGSCLYNTSCFSGQYFHFGTCYNASSLCATFNAFTGDCFTCKDSSNLLVNGSCVPVPVVCADRQYLVNRTCLNVSTLCGSFSNATGLCTSCTTTEYVLHTNGSCVLKDVVCAANQYQVNRVCLDIPKECRSFNLLAQKCEKCRQGFWPSSLGVCQQVICSPRQFPAGYGLFCSDVSPTCGAFDALTGDCLTCKNADATLVDGKCKQTTGPLAGCMERERLGFGPCVGVEANCNLYHLQKGNCIECIPSWFFDYRGLCALRAPVCQADELSIKGFCLQRPANCAQYDQIGLCLLCNAGYRIIFGQCYLAISCLANQYQSERGTCVDVTAGCIYYNPTTGVCITCADGRSAINGLCCAPGLNAFNGQCVDPLKSTVVDDSGLLKGITACKTFHPLMGICLECYGDSKVNPADQATCL